MSDPKAGRPTPATGEGAPGIDFERWADLAAKRMSRDRDARREILKQQGVDEADWKKSDEHWRAALRADLVAGNDERAQAYAERCVRERDRRENEVVASEPAPAAKPSPEPAPAPPLAREVEVPTYALASPVLAFAAATPTPPARAELTLVGGGPTNSDLPFQAGAGHQPAVSPAGTAPAPSGAAGNTVALTQGSTDAPLPFAPAFAGIELTLEQYAAFRAELGVFPEKRAELLAKYGIRDGEAQRHLDETWRKRFAADRTAQKRFVELGANLREQLVAQRRT